MNVEALSKSLTGLASVMPVLVEGREVDDWEVDEGVYRLILRDDGPEPEGRVTLHEKQDVHAYTGQLLLGDFTELGVDPTHRGGGAHVRLATWRVAVVQHNLGATDGMSVAVRDRNDFPVPFGVVVHDPQCVLVFVTDTIVRTLSAGSTLTVVVEG